MTADGMSPGAGFEGGWLAEGLADDATLECGICWRVYDPVVGDLANGVERGTPFMRLSADWRCPECQAPKDKFMVVAAGSGPKRGPQAQTMQSRLDALLGAYRDADLAMASLPIYNPKLTIAALGFRPHPDGLVGALVTPWFLNLVVLPAAKSDETRPPGAVRTLTFPSGAYVFSAVKLERVGGFEFLSLFSPMQEFENQEAAVLAAQAALEALFTPAEQPQPKAPAPDASRRTLLFGRRRAETAAPAG
jgi:[NiFe] hydrogenase assembly HybE family chaperone